MHIVKPYDIKYWVFCWNGEIYGPYKNQNEFAKYWNHIRSNFRSRFGNTFWSPGYENDPFWINWFTKNPSKDGTIFGNYILKNEFGDVIHPDEVNNILYQYRIKKLKINQKFYTWRKSRSYYGRGYRNIKTQRDRRWAHAHEDEGIKPRGKRSKAILPNAWDDIHAGRRGNNWKYYRKHQYKIKEK